MHGSNTFGTHLYGGVRAAIAAARPNVQSYKRKLTHSVYNGYRTTCVVSAMHSFGRFPRLPFYAERTTSASVEIISTDNSTRRADPIVVFSASPPPSTDWLTGTQRDTTVTAWRHGGPLTATTYDAKRDDECKVGSWMSPERPISEDTPLCECSLLCSSSLPVAITVHSTHRQHYKRLVKGCVKYSTQR